MRATEILREEHRVIERVLGCLEKMAKGVRAGDPLDVGDARDVVVFLQQFADANHHAKEESWLFPALEEAGMPRDGGPTGIMLTEHDVGRDRIAAMVQAIDAMAGEEESAALRFAEAATAYVELLTQHIAKENEILFFMAEQMLSPESGDRVLTGFQEVDEEHAESVATCLRIASRLGASWQVPLPPPASAGGSGGGCGGGGHACDM